MHRRRKPRGLAALGLIITAAFLCGWTAVLQSRIHFSPKTQSNEADTDAILRSNGALLPGLKRKHELAVIFLVRTPPLEDRPVLGLLEDLRTNFLPNNPADVIIMHGNDAPADGAAPFFAQYSDIAQVIPVPQEYWKLPSHLNESGLSKWVHPHTGIKYRLMCRFYSQYLHRFLHAFGYQWVLRLDSDSRLPGPVTTNLVHYMVANKKQYGYVAVASDSPECVRWLPEAVRLWMQVHGLSSDHLFKHCSPPSIDGLTSDGWQRSIYYNNFFLTNVTWWLQPSVSAFFDYLAATDGFFFFRWGDAPVQTITVQLFMKEEETARLTGFKYYHDLRSYGSP